jgi:hypothetical protein
MFYSDHVKMCKHFTRALATKELAVASQCTISHFLLHQGILTKNNMAVISHPSSSPYLFPCAFSVTLIEDKIERQPF